VVNELGNAEGLAQISASGETIGKASRLKALLIYQCLTVKGFKYERTIKDKVDSGRQV
jgi:hypothetical protein